MEDDRDDQEEEGFYFSTSWAQTLSAQVFKNRFALLMFDKKPKTALIV